MWFNQYGWKSNPFLIKPFEVIIGSDEVKNKVMNYIHGSNICFIYGDAGVGKTSLLKWIESNLKKYWCVYLNAEYLGKDFDLTKFLISNTRFLRRLRGYEYPKNCVILVDEAQELNKEVKCNLKAFYDENQIKSIVFVQNFFDLKGLDNMKERIGARIINIKEISDTQVFDLIKIRVGGINPFTEGAINVLGEAGNYNPRNILELCEKVCIKLDGKNEINVNDVKRILQFKPSESVKESNSLSPMQNKIVDLLKSGNKTVKELSQMLETSEGSVGKQLSKLTLNDVVVVVSHKRPKVYGVKKDE